jgi:oligopeptide transport system substrate-binding protein
VRRTQMAVATASAAVLALAACAGDPDDVGDDDDGVDGGTVNMHIGEVPTLFPGKAGDSESFRILKNIYDGLVYYDYETGEPVNVIASDIHSEDNVTWTVEIEEGHTFHNGEPVNAESFIRSWNWTAFGPNAADLNYFFERFAGYDEMNPDPLPEEEWADPDTPEYPDPDADALSGLSAPAEYTLQVELKEAFVGFPTMLGYVAFFPTAEECMADIDHCEWNPIGTGPFIMDGTYDVAAGGAIVRWEDYQGDKPSIERANWHVYTGGADCWADFQTGDIDICRPSAADFAAAINNPDYNTRLIQQEGTSFTYLGFPLYDDRFEDVNLRRALSAAIDREAVLNVIGKERGVPADGWVPASIFGGGQSLCEYCEHDPELAQQLLDEAGGWPEGEPLRIWYNESADNQTLFRAVADTIQESLDIEYELVPLDWPDYLAQTAAHGLDGPFRLGWGPDYNLNENYLTPLYGSPASANRFGYASDDFMSAIAAADGADSLDEAVELYVDAERVLAEDMPNIPLLFSVENVFYSERVDNVLVHPIYAGPGGDCELRDIVVVE